MTRSTVQKAVVVIINEPRHLGQLRQKLSIVTSAWFAQRYGHCLLDSPFLRAPGIDWLGWERDGGGSELMLASQ